MKRLAVISIMLIVFLTCARAQSREDFPRITYGAEWSFVASGYSAYHYNFFSTEGYRYNLKGAAAEFTSNGEALLHVGYNVTDSWNLAIYTGFTGISDIHNAIPLSFRTTRLFKPKANGDRWFAFADIGSGISLKDRPQPITCGKIGGGYRLSLSRYSKLDFLMALRAVYTHPDISYNGETIIPTKISRNDGIICSLSIGIGFTF